MLVVFSSYEGAKMIYKIKTIIFLEKINKKSSSTIKIISDFVFLFFFYFF